MPFLGHICTKPPKVARGTNLTLSNAPSYPTVCQFLNHQHFDQSEVVLHGSFYILNQSKMTLKSWIFYSHNVFKFLKSAMFGSYLHNGAQKQEPNRDPPHPSKIWTNQCKLNYLHRLLGTPELRNRDKGGGQVSVGLWTSVSTDKCQKVCGQVSVRTSVSRVADKCQYGQVSVGLRTGIHITTQDSYAGPVLGFAQKYNFLEKYTPLSCTWLHLAVPGCTQLDSTAPGCTWRHLAAPG